MKQKLKITLNAPIVIGIVVICLVAMFLNWMIKGISNQLLFMTYHSSLKMPMTYVRFFTHIFGHVNWEHFVGNMCYILLSRSYIFVVQVYVREERNKKSSMQILSTEFTKLIEFVEVTILLCEKYIEVKDKGVNIKVIQELCGHTRSDVTLDIYTM